MKGYIQVYTGKGKGKTTAAIGLAIRAAGAGLNVFFGQFLKGGRYSEHLSLECFSDQITLKLFGSGIFIQGNPSQTDYELARRGLREANQAIREDKFDVIILDELNVALSYNLISLEEVLKLILNKRDKIELILTGRYAHEQVIEAADLVTEMKEIKHYKNSGVESRVGIKK